MSAYNWITVDAQCPACGRSVAFRCQTHVASSYGGDENGRFFDCDYVLGQRMSWRPVRFDRDWRGGNSLAPLPPNEDLEACYSTCSRCGREVIVVLRFQEMTPTRVESVSLEWPDGFK